MDKMVESVEKILDDKRKELTAETAELKEEQKFMKGHKEAIDKYREELEMEIKADRKKIIELQKAIDKVEQHYSKLMASHDTSIHNIEDKDRIVKSIDYDIQRLERHLKILKLQAEGWVIFSIDRWHHTREYLGAHDRNNYRPNGWYVLDIIAKPTGIYMRTTLSQNYRKIYKPGEVSITMVLRDTLTYKDKDEFKHIVSGHTCEKPKILKYDA